MDAAPVEALSQAKRYQIILLFGAVGPLVGLLCAMGVVTVGSFSYFLQGAPVFIALGYWFGIVSALLAGIAYALSPMALQRILLSPVFGALAGAIAAPLIGFPMPYTVALFGGVGAVAALVCAIAARVLKLDLRSAAA